MIRSHKARTRNLGRVLSEPVGSQHTFVTKTAPNTGPGKAEVEAMDADLEPVDNGENDEDNDDEDKLQNRTRNRKDMSERLRMIGLAGPEASPTR
ncbi:unnamed protein product [Echinostoma caproni]|uniref:Uncharacterized protein n=1 Tax=Echinostoma caproni TaxID=27848 RepID=A0A183AGI3_9TREM|nr:unnamed protein product [Echinostoma caproni]